MANIECIEHCENSALPMESCSHASMSSTPNPPHPLSLPCLTHPFQLEPIHLLRHAVVHTSASASPLRSAVGEQRTAIVAVAVEVLVAIRGPAIPSAIVSPAPSLKQAAGRDGKEMNIPSPRIQRPARGVGIDVRDDLDARREGALAAVLLPPDVVVRRDGALVVCGGGVAVLRVGAGRVVLGRKGSVYNAEQDDVGLGDGSGVRRTKM
jgi:hypothetical protein